MEQTPKQIVIFRNFLILILLTGTTLTGLLAGHVIRYSIPEIRYQFIPEHQGPFVPGGQFKTENGLEFEFKGERRIIMAMTDSRIRVLSEGALTQENIPGLVCVSLTYYTSLPAKCLANDSQFVRVGYLPQDVIFNPPGTEVPSP